MIAVAQGEPKHAERYCGKIAPGLECLARDDTVVYYQYGLSRIGLKGLTHPGNITAGIRLMQSGQKFGQVIGDLAMMPGTFIVDTDGRLQFAHYNQHMGDHPAFETLLQATGKLSA